MEKNYYFVFSKEDYYFLCSILEQYVAGERKVLKLLKLKPAQREEIARNIEQADGIHVYLTDGRRCV